LIQDSLIPHSEKEVKETTASKGTENKDTTEQIPAYE